jgi:hypothetical protein
MIQCWSEKTDLVRTLAAQAKALQTAAVATAKQIAVKIDPTDIVVDGAKGMEFLSYAPTMDDTREVWFIKNGYLYEVTTFKELDSWLAQIMQTWKFI